LEDTGATVEGGDCGELEQTSALRNATIWMVRRRKLTMKLPVHKSAPVKTIATRPKGKIIAANNLMTPGAFS
jgi:hypothetical protein